MENKELYYLSASELINHIQAEKERLIKEKLIKKTSPLPPVKAEEKPYELPDGWEWVRLGEIGLTQTGTTPKTSNPEYYNGTYPLLKPNDIYENYINYDTDYKLTELGLKNGRTIESNSVVMVCIGTIGKSYIVDRVCSCNQQINYVKPYLSSMSSKYLLFALNSSYFKIQLEKQTSATTVKIINKSRWENLLIPLPPLYIQDQIVQKLEHLSETKEGLLAHAESQLNYTKKMRESLLQEAIRGELIPQDENDEPVSVLLEKIKTEKERLIKEKVIKKQKELPPITDEEKPYELPIGWEWVRLGEYFDITMGSSPKGNTVGDDLDGVEFHQGKVYFTDKYLKQSLQKTIEPTKIANPNDVLLSVRAPVGTVNITQREVCIGRGLCAIRPYLTDMPHQYIYYGLNAIKEEFIRQATGTTFIAITADIIRNQLFPLPPLAEQERIVGKLDELMVNCDQLETKAKEMSNYTTKLFEASLKEAFMPE